MSLRSASRRRQQRLLIFRERAAQQLDVDGVFQCNLRAGGGPAAARRFWDRRVTVEWSATEANIT